MLLEIASKLTDLLGPIRTMSKDHRETRDNALRAISHALNETYIYYRNQEKTLKRDESIENQLSKYWSAAAIPMRHIDEQLALTCEHKSEYWLNPSNYSESEIKDLGIALGEVRKQYRKTLVPRFSTAGRKA